MRENTCGFLTLIKQTSMHQNQSASPPLQTADDSMDESTDESMDEPEVEVKIVISDH